MSKVKYFGYYHGPSYGSMDQDFADGFFTLADAKQSMRNRQGGWDGAMEFRQNADYNLVLWDSGSVNSFLATTTEDYMDLYTATLNDDGTYYQSLVTAYRLTIGERGGIVVERF